LSKFVFQTQYLCMTPREAMGEITQINIQTVLKRKRKIEGKKIRFAPKQTR